MLTLASISYWWYQTNSGVLNWARVRVCFISQEFSFSSVRRWMWYFFFQKLHGLAFGWEDKNSLLQLQSCWDTDLSLISHERDKESCTSKAGSWGTAKKTLALKRKVQNNNLMKDELQAISQLLIFMCMSQNSALMVPHRSLCNIKRGIT